MDFEKASFKGLKERPRLISLAEALCENAQCWGGMIRVVDYGCGWAMQCASRGLGIAGGSHADFSGAS